MIFIFLKLDYVADAWHFYLTRKKYLKGIWHLLKSFLFNINLNIITFELSTQCITRLPDWKVI